MENKNEPMKRPLPSAPATLLPVVIPSGMKPRWWLLTQLLRSPPIQPGRTT